MCIPSLNFLLQKTDLASPGCQNQNIERMIKIYVGRSEIDFQWIIYK